ncbi:MAG: class I SAM-dependent methyltransferase [Chloroflexi bacterium]|nr:class I SAM-dependent methyltransferase [Chloroflexota bacterium]
MDYVRWAERYDIFYEAAPEGELDFYLNAIQRSRGSVLELGVGTGRIAIPAAAMGHDITGVDLNETMLDRAREKSSRAPLSGKLNLIRADMATLDLEKTDYDLIVIPAHTLALITDEKRQFATLKRCAYHMADDAKLIFNLFNPSDDLINDEPTETFLLGVVQDEERGLRHVLTGSNEFDIASQTNLCLQTIETLDASGAVIDREQLTVVFRYLHHHQVVQMLDRAGLRATSVYGEFDGSALTPDSEEMIYECRLA